MDTPTPQTPPSPKKSKKLIIFGGLMLLIMAGATYAWVSKPVKPKKIAPVATQANANKPLTLSCSDNNNLQALKAYLNTVISDSTQKNLTLSRDAFDASQRDNWLKNTQVTGFKNIRTNAKESEHNLLVCESVITLKAPTAMWTEAAKAMDLPQECSGEECEIASYVYTLDELMANHDMRLKDGTLEGSLQYKVAQADNGDITLEIVRNYYAPTDVISEAMSSALRINAITARSVKLQADAQAMNQLTQRAIEIRVKELTELQAQLNTQMKNALQESGDAAGAFQASQNTWESKRDVECKLEGNKALYNLSEEEQEPYQVNYQNWTADMAAQDQIIRTLKCSNKRTQARIKEMRPKA